MNLAHNQLLRIESVDGPYISILRRWGGYEVGIERFGHFEIEWFAEPQDAFDFIIAQTS